MVEACERIILFSAGLTDAALMNREFPQRGAVLHQFVVLGEAAKHVGQPYRLAWPGIPWADITGMRDKLVHYYMGIDDAVVLDAVRTSVPAVLPQLRAMLKVMDSEDSEDAP
jgi:uncharacterized protein with HEPN domain